MKPEAANVGLWHLPDLAVSTLIVRFRALYRHSWRDGWQSSLDPLRKSGPIDSTIAQA
jgi:hypothetical protein